MTREQLDRITSKASVLADLTKSELNAIYRKHFPQFDADGILEPSEDPRNLSRGTIIEELLTEEFYRECA